MIPKLVTLKAVSLLVRNLKISRKIGYALCVA